MLEPYYYIFTNASRVGTTVATWASTNMIAICSLTALLLVVLLLRLIFKRR